MALDEDSRMAGLRPVRDAGYRRILGEVGGAAPAAGARASSTSAPATGWFLEAAGAGGAQAVGIEPDAGVAAAARDRGLDVRVGYFPEALRADDRFHVVAYNDVFEHLPDPDAILEATRAALAPAGLLTIAIPTSEGLGYRLVLWAAALGFMTPLRRLWQFDFPSPHVWYFDERSLGSLLERSGFVLERVGRLPEHRAQRPARARQLRPAPQRRHHHFGGAGLAAGPAQPPGQQRRHVHGPSPRLNHAQRPLHRHPRRLRVLEYDRARAHASRASAARTSPC